MLFKVRGYIRSSFRVQCFDIDFVHLLRVGLVGMFQIQRLEKKWECCKMVWTFYFSFVFFFVVSA